MDTQEPQEPLPTTIPGLIAQGFRTYGLQFAFLLAAAVFYCDQRSTNQQMLTESKESTARLVQVIDKFSEATSATAKSMNEVAVQMEEGHGKVENMKSSVEGIKSSQEMIKSTLDRIETNTRIRQ